MKYGKLIEGHIHYAPSVLHLGNEVIVAPTGAQLLKCGYLPLKFTRPDNPAPDGTHYEQDGWEETGDAIIPTWKIVPNGASCVRTFSKFKCVEALTRAGIWTKVRKYLMKKGLYDLYLAAQGFREDNEYFKACKSELQTTFGMSDAQVEEILSECEA